MANSPDKIEDTNLIEALKTAKLRLLELEFQWSAQDFKHQISFYVLLFSIPVMIFSLIIVMSVITDKDATKNGQVVGIVFLTIVIYTIVLASRRFYSTSMAKKFLNIAIVRLKDIILEAESYFKERV